MMWKQLLEIASWERWMIIILHSDLSCDAHRKKGITKTMILITTHLLQCRLQMKISLLIINQIYQMHLKWWIKHTTVLIFFGVTRRETKCFTICFNLKLFSASTLKFLIAHHHTCANKSMVFWSLIIPWERVLIFQ